jgi:hypothetical protein
MKTVRRIFLQFVLFFSEFVAATLDVSMSSTIALSHAPVCENVIIKKMRGAVVQRGGF